MYRHSCFADAAAQKSPSMMRMANEFTTTCATAVRSPPFSKAMPAPARRHARRYGGAQAFQPARILRRRVILFRLQKAILLPVYHIPPCIDTPFATDRPKAFRAAAPNARALFFRFFCRQTPEQKQPPAKSLKRPLPGAGGGLPNERLPRPVYAQAPFSPSGNRTLLTKKKITMEIPPLSTVVPML